MNGIIQPIVLGLVQGVGEFLPISSTAHLILVPYFTGWSDPGLTFDIALHIGTLFAVLSFFWKDWLNIFQSAFASVKNQGIKNFKNELLYFLIIGTIPGMLIGLLLEKKAETAFRSPLIIAITLIIAGSTLYLADKYPLFRHSRESENLSLNKNSINPPNVNLKNSLIIGLAQAIAIIPGVSRSGATITAGLFCKFDKISAARFSFLLSTPIIFGAAVLKIPSLLSAGITAPIIVGILSSALSGFLAIKYLLKFLEKYGYGVFFWYRLALGLTIIIFYFWK